MTGAESVLDGGRPTVAGTAPERAPGRRGRTRIGAEKIARIVARSALEVPGVHSLATRRPVPPAHPGVSVQVGEHETTVDLELVTRYGQNVLELTSTVRSTVVERVEAATGLTVLDVNITVDDIVIPDSPAAGTRVNRQPEH